MKRARRLFVYALLGSLALHLLFLASGASWWRTPEASRLPPLEARLHGQVPASEARAASVPARPDEAAVAAVPILPRAAPPIVAAAGPTGQAEDASAAEVFPPAEVPRTPEPLVAGAPSLEAAPAPAMPEPVAAAPAVLRALPESLTLRYDVRAGDEGLNLGEAVYSWSRRDDRYQLVSVAEASGLVSLFVSGKLVQRSEGALTRTGLRPESYWLERNGRRKDAVSFDWARGRLTQGDQEAALPAGAQDLLSFPFHLAQIIEESSPELRLWVSNGRKLREYAFRRLGHERLRLGKAEVDTLHLRGESEGEDRLDVWLAPSRQWLPLRIRTLDSKGKVMLLSLEAIS